MKQTLNTVSSQIYQCVYNYTKKKHTYHRLYNFSILEAPYKNLIRAKATLTLIKKNNETNP